MDRVGDEYRGGGPIHPLSIDRSQTHDASAGRGGGRSFSSSTSNASSLQLPTSPPPPLRSAHTHRSDNGNHVIDEATQTARAAPKGPLLAPARSSTRSSLESVPRQREGYPAPPPFQSESSISSTGGGRGGSDPLVAVTPPSPSPSLPVAGTCDGTSPSPVPATGGSRQGGGEAAAFQRDPAPSRHNVRSAAAHSSSITSGSTAGGFRTSVLADSPTVLYSSPEDHDHQILLSLNQKERGPSGISESARSHDWRASATPLRPGERSTRAAGADNHPHPHSSTSMTTGSATLLRMSVVESDKERTPLPGSSVNASSSLVADMLSPSPIVPGSNITGAGGWRQRATGGARGVEDRLNPAESADDGVDGAGTGFRLVRSSDDHRLPLERYVVTGNGASSLLTPPRPRTTARNTLLYGGSSRSPYSIAGPPSRDDVPRASHHSRAGSQGGGGGGGERYDDNEKGSSIFRRHRYTNKNHKNHNDHTQRGRRAPLQDRQGKDVAHHHHPHQDGPQARRGIQLSDKQVRLTEEEEERENRAEMRRRMLELGLELSPTLDPLMIPTTTSSTSSLSSSSSLVVVAGAIDHQRRHHSYYAYVDDDDERGEEASRSSSSRTTTTTTTTTQSSSTRMWSKTSPTCMSFLPRDGRDDLRYSYEDEDEDDYYGAIGNDEEPRLAAPAAAFPFAGLDKAGYSSSHPRQWSGTPRKEGSLRVRYGSSTSTSATAGLHGTTPIGIGLSSSRSVVGGRRSDPSCGLSSSLRRLEASGVRVVIRSGEEEEEEGNGRRGSRGGGGVVVASFPGTAAAWSPYEPQRRSTTTRGEDTPHPAAAAAAPRFFSYDHLSTTTTTAAAVSGLPAWRSRASAGGDVKRPSSSPSPSSLLSGPMLRYGTTREGSSWVPREEEKRWNPQWMGGDGQGREKEEVTEKAATDESVGGDRHKEASQKGGGGDGGVGNGESAGPPPPPPSSSSRRPPPPPPPLPPPQALSSTASSVASVSVVPPPPRDTEGWKTSHRDASTSPLPLHDHRSVGSSVSSLTPSPSGHPTATATANNNNNHNTTNDNKNNDHQNITPEVKDGHPDRLNVEERETNEKRGSVEELSLLQGSLGLPHGSSTITGGNVTLLLPTSRGGGGGSGVSATVSKDILDVFGGSHSSSEPITMSRGGRGAESTGGAPMMDHPLHYKDNNNNRNHAHSGVAGAPKVLTPPPETFSHVPPFSPSPSPSSSFYRFTSSGAPTGSPQSQSQTPQAYPPHPSVSSSGQAMPPPPSALATSFHSFHPSASLSASARRGMRLRSATVTTMGGSQASFPTHTPPPQRAASSVIYDPEFRMAAAAEAEAEERQIRDKLRSSHHRHHHYRRHHHHRTLSHQDDDDDDPLPHHHHHQKTPQQTSRTHESLSQRHPSLRALSPPPTLPGDSPSRSSRADGWFPSSGWTSTKGEGDEEEQGGGGNVKGNGMWVPSPSIPSTPGLPPSASTHQIMTMSHEDEVEKQRQEQLQLREAAVAAASRITVHIPVPIEVERDFDALHTGAVSHRREGERRRSRGQHQHHHQEQPLQYHPSRHDGRRGAGGVSSPAEGDGALVPMALLHANSTFDLPTSIRILTRGDFFFFLTHSYSERNVFAMYKQITYDRRCKAVPQFIWLDLQNYLLVWSPSEIPLTKPKSRRSLFRKSMKLEQIYQISCRSFTRPVEEDQHLRGGADDRRRREEEGSGKRGGGRGSRSRPSRHSSRSGKSGSASKRRAVGGEGITYYVLAIQSAKEVVELTTASQNKADTWYDALHNVCEFVRHTSRDRRPEIPD